MIEDGFFVSVFRVLRSAEEYSWWLCVMGDVEAASAETTRRRLSGTCVRSAKLFFRGGGRQY